VETVGRLGIRFMRHDQIPSSVEQTESISFQRAWRMCQVTELRKMAMLLGSGDWIGDRFIPASPLRSGNRADDLTAR